MEQALEKMRDKGILVLRAGGCVRGSLVPRIPSCFSAPSIGAWLPSVQQVLCHPTLPHQEADWALGGGSLLVTSTCQRVSSPKVSKGLSDKVP